MKSVKEIRTIAYNLVKLSFDEHKKLDPSRIEGIINLISSNSLDSIGIKVERTQTTVLFKQYYHYLKNLIRENSATITTAIPMTSTQKATLTEMMNEKFQKDQIDFVVDKSLIGGIKIQNGWDIIDDTIDNKLHTLNF